MYILPDYVRNIIKKLEDNRHKAYLVGGCVRDMLLGKTPHDYDIATSCLPDEICALFDKTVCTGIKHGTVTVVTDGDNVEVTTFRRDGQYSNHRSPDNVDFVPQLEYDLARRDFTINAMAFNEATGVTDIYGGKEDLKNKIIRTVGEPDKRFKEDALRILRAIRFASRFGFSIEEETLNAIKNNAYLLKDISAERIFSELSQILTTDNPSLVSVICICGGFSHLGIGQIKTPDLLNTLKNSENLRFYAFCKLCDINSTQLCKLLKTNNYLKKYCSNLDFAKDISLAPTKAHIKHMLKRLSFNEVADYLEYIRVFSQTDISNAEAFLKEIIDNREPYLVKHLAIDGNCLLKMGYREAQIGEMLEKLLETVIDNHSLNTREKLINLIKNM